MRSVFSVALVTLYFALLIGVALCGSDAESTVSVVSDPQPSNPEATRQMEPGEAQYIRALEQLYVMENITAAAELLEHSASAGWAKAHPMLGVLYQYGIGVDQSDAMAVLHHEIGALGGAVDSHLALMYRKQHAIGVPKSCQGAAAHAKFAADQVAKTYSHDIQPRVPQIKLAELDIGSVDERKTRQFVNEQEYLAGTGAVGSVMQLGYANLWGAFGVKQDGQAAIRYFEEAVELGEAGGHGALGQLFSQGMSTATPPINPDLNRALEEFEKGAEKKHAVSLNGLGYMYATGNGVDQSFARAAQYFEESANQKNPEGLYNAGVLYLNGKGVVKDVRKAVNFFRQAASAGNVLAHWQLGTLHFHNVMVVQPSCHEALKHFQKVLERAPWNQRLNVALESYNEGSYTASLIQYLLVAETGNSIGRINAAFLVERGLGFGDASIGGASTEEEWEKARLEVLLQLIRRSAQHGDAHAHLKLGDHYFYGIGCDVDYEKAEEHYAIAASGQISQAMYNLGYMRHFGIGGQPRDFHLAKRYYDQALDSSSFYAVKLALVALNFNWWMEFYSSQPGGLSGALIPSPFGVPVDDVLLAFFAGLSVLLLLIRNHAVANAQR